MQFSAIVALSLSAMAAAAPAEAVQDSVVARGGGGGYPSEMWCPSGSRSEGCCPCENHSCQQAQGGGGDYYSSCSYNKQLALVDVFVCDVLNDNKVSIPISVPINLL